MSTFLSILAACRKYFTMALVIQLSLARVSHSSKVEHPSTNQKVDGSTPIRNTQISFSPSRPVLFTR